MSWNPKAFLGTQIECQHVWFISVSGTQFKIHNFSSWRVHFKLRICSREPYLLLRTWTSKLLTSFSKITLGAIITDIWGERVKHVKHGPRNNDKAAYLNIKRFKDGIRKLFGFTLENISISQTRTGERVAPGHYIFPICAWPWNCPWSCLDLFRQATPLNLMVLSLIWSMFWKILAAQLQGKSPAYYNGWKTYPSALDLFWKRAKQLLPYSQTQQVSVRTLKIVPRSHKRECFLTFV